MISRSAHLVADPFVTTSCIVLTAELSCGCRASAATGLSTSAGKAAHTVGSRSMRTRFLTRPRASLTSSRFIQLVEAKSDHSRRSMAAALVAQDPTPKRPPRSCGGNMRKPFTRSMVLVPIYRARALVMTQSRMTTMMTPSIKRLRRVPLVTEARHCVGTNQIIELALERTVKVHLFRDDQPEPVYPRCHRHDVAPS